MEKRVKHVLFTVLDWGLGHATRSIPIIESLLRQGTKVSLAGEGNSLVLLKNTFPNLNFYDLKGIQIVYPKDSSLAFEMMRQVSTIMKSIKREHEQVQQLVELLNPDAIISDSRFGAYSPHVKSVFITHQIGIKSSILPFLVEPFLYWMNKNYIKKFDLCWIPDFEVENNLSGSLSHNEKFNRDFNLAYIGPLSRFQSNNLKSTSRLKSSIVVLLSGPEPQRSIFEQKCIDELKKINRSAIIVRGKPNENSSFQDGKILLLSHMLAEDLKALLLEAETIVCRSGYSSMMDLAAIGKNAIVVPTPGQTEQEYLAIKLDQEKRMVYQKQESFNIILGMEELKNCKPFLIENNSNLDLHISNFLESLQN
jgi:uncharacterized protein (TIGR00661 family)